MKWFSLIKYLSQALSDWWQEWKPVIEAEKAAKQAAREAAMNRNTVDATFTEVKTPMP